MQTQRKHGRAATSAALLVATTLVACATPAPPAERAEASTRSAPAATSAQPRTEPSRYAVESTTAPVAVEASAPAVQRAPERRADELAIWNDPDFQRRFVESYLAETEVEPRITLDEREAMETILEYISENQTDRAVDRLRAERERGGSAVFDFTLANIHFQREELEPASEAYEAAIGKFPNFRRAYKNLGLIRVREGDFQRAAEAFTRVIELGGGDSDTYGLLGYAYTNTGDFLSAESAYRMASLLDPANWDWKMGMARAFFKQKRYGEAVALTDTMIAQDPGRAELWMLQANAYIGLGKPMQAAKNFEVVDRLGGSTTAGLNNLGDIYVNEGLFDLAVASYLRAIRSDDEAGLDRALRAARVLTAQGALDETQVLVEGIQAAREGNLDTAEQLDLLRLEARLAVANGGGESEVRVLERIVEIDPLDGEALLLLGQHWFRSGDAERATLYFERAENIEGFEADAKVRRAQLLVSQGKYNEALPLLRSAQTLKPRDHVQAYLEQVERISKNR